MSELTKKRVRWKEYNGEELVHDEDVDVLTSASAVTFSDGEDLQDKYTKGQLVQVSTTGLLSNLSTTNKSSLVDAVNEVKTDATSNESSITSLTNRVTTAESDIDNLETRVTPITKGGTGATTSSGALTNLGITATASELNYCDGVTSNIQTQLDNKAESSHTHTFDSLTSKPTTISGYGITDSIGKNLGGQTVSPTSGTTVKAGTNAEIFNDYRTRTFNDSGSVSAGNIASGNYSHAEGIMTTASGNYSHAEGGMTTASGNYSHAEGYSKIASGAYSHAEGCMTIASGNQSHAEGGYTTASGLSSHAEGHMTTASSSYSHAEGRSTTASGSYSHAEGYDTNASGSYSHAEGNGTTASGDYSHAEGYDTTASGSYSHAGGYCTIAKDYQLVHGRYNKSSSGPDSDTSMTGDIFIIGNGTSGTATGNALRTTTAGKTYGLDSFSGSGAGVAELFEWQDGNPNAEDRRGLFVTLDGEKIKIASPDDSYILGAIDPCPYVVGDVQSEIWKDMYLKDVFGQKLIETVEVEETTGEDGSIIPAHTEKRWILNPEYDSKQTYISRDDRKEFDAITSKGKVVMLDDGTCQVNGYCTVGEGGKATASDTNYSVRVLKRIDDTHILVYIDSVFINR